MKVKLNKQGYPTLNEKPVIIPAGALRWLQSQPEGAEAFVKDSDILPGMSVGNGSVYTKTGSRQVVFTASGELRPVVDSYNKGYQSERCTIQQYIAAEDDLILKTSWGHGDPGDTIMMVLPNGQECPFDFRFEIPEKIESFLLNWEERRRGSSYLPQ